MNRQQFPDLMKVRCEKRGASSNIFTDQKIYEVTHVKGPLYEIFDDKGIPRVIIPNAPCPFLKEFGYGPGGFVTERVVGFFQIVPLKQKEGETTNGD